MRRRTVLVETDIRSAAWAMVIQVAAMGAALVAMLGIPCTRTRTARISD